MSYDAANIDKEPGLPLNEAFFGDVNFPKFLDDMDTTHPAQWHKGFFKVSIYVEYATYVSLFCFQGRNIKGDERKGFNV